ncbi:ATP-binding cassette domain-containing protein [Microbacterium sp.]|uniref:ATP-binding cassette domain-containing protein n=1 Tax=Microbacterium sp. TaxID=51671 RepID=UPI003A8DB542
MLVVGLTWIGAVMVARGELRVGELVAFYGYAGFMVLPVTLFNQVIRVVVRGMISARAIVEMLEVASPWPDAVGADVEVMPPTRDGLHDTRTGLTVHDGEQLAVVVRDSQEAQALVDRLARLASDGEDTVLLDGRPLSGAPIGEVRRRIVASDPVPFLFSGTLRELLDPWGRHDDDGILRAVAAVDAVDILAPLDEGLDVQVGERGIEFSGGQRQRLGAARALLTEAPILLLHDPTSAVDAATEERMAAGIRSYRTGRTTIIVTTSPLVLSGADRVVVVQDSAIRAEGTHEELVRADPEYRRAVLRAEGVS